jgi:uncharacterized protein YoxC
MKYLRQYDSFLNEDIFFPTADDPVEVKNKMNSSNQLYKWVKEYPSKKNLIAQIFQNYKDENEKFSKLKPFLKDQNPKTLTFENDLLGLWAEVCELNRKISNIDKDITNKKEEISTEQSGMAGADKSSQDMMKQNIDLIQQKIGNSDIEKKSLEAQILSKNKEAQEKLKKYEEDLKQWTKELNIYNQQKLKKI